MKFNKTVQIMQELGRVVVQDGRQTLNKLKKQTKSNTLYKDFDYIVVSDNQGVYVEWVFGGASDYWDFVNEGVRGSGGFKGSGKMRGQGSPYSFKKNNIARGVVMRWIANKPLKLRNAKGKFIEKNQANLKSASFVIGRAIAQRGLTRTLFFDKAYNKQVAKYEEQILNAFANDLEKELENTINKI